MLLFRVLFNILEETLVFVYYFVSSRIEARVNLDAFRSSFEYIVAAEHPTAIVE